MNILWTWKFLRTTRWIRICSPFVRHASLASIATMQQSTSGSSVQRRKTPGILSRMFPHFTSITYYRVRSFLAPRIAMLCFVMPCLLRIYCFFPLFFSGRPRDRRWCVWVRLHHRRPFFLCNRASRQAPPWSPDIAYSFSLLLALE